MKNVTFSDFRFSEPIAAALATLQYTTPTPIQRLAIEPQRAGRDLLGIACTGSGKTAAFGLPLLEAVLAPPRSRAPHTCRALVLAPTRELAHQIVSSLRAFGGSARPRVSTVIGGEPRRGQIAVLSRGADIVVATPGRLLDLMQANAVALHETRHLVIDEADRMLDLGFLWPVRRIAAALPPEHQTVMFSATMPEPVALLAAQLLNAPVRVEALPPLGPDRAVRARAEVVPPGVKPRRLVELLSTPAVTSAIVFCRTRRGADALGRLLGRSGLRVAVIHGDRSQADRSRTLAQFRRGQVVVLVATDLVARGIDVPGVSHVVNYDLPDHAEGYIHRIGRTGRAGARGEAVTLCTPREIGHLRRIERAIDEVLLPPICRTCRVALASGRPVTGRRAGSCAAAGGVC